MSPKESKSSNEFVQQILLEEFRKLLQEMAERKSQNFLRFRKVGEPWQQHFLQVYDVNKGGVFYDHEDKEFVYVTDLSEIGEFQLNKPTGMLAAETTYEVMPISFL
jgi:hypothetical protein